MKEPLNGLKWPRRACRWTGSFSVLTFIFGSAFKPLFVENHGYLLNKLRILVTDFLEKHDRMI